MSCKLAARDLHLFAVRTVHGEFCAIRKVVFLQSIVRKGSIAVIAKHGAKVAHPLVVLRESPGHHARAVVPQAGHIYVITLF
jgi:hypothetical protein